MENDLHTEFEDFYKAKVCANQQNYKLAAELYSEGLIKASKKYKEDDPQLCRLYIDYASSLIINSENYFTDELSLLSNHRSVNIVERQSIEDDLQVAWDLLEISRVVLAKETCLMSKIHYLLGEILLINNNFTEAILEYSKCIVLLKPENVRYSECLFKIANCYEFNKNYASANQNLSKIIEACEINRKTLGDGRTNNLIEEIKMRMELNEGKEIQDNNVIQNSTESEDEEKPIIDISMNIKKKQ